MKGKSSGIMLFAVTLAITMAILSNCATANEFIVHKGESIQNTINNSQPGDVIIVEPGVYRDQISIYTDDLSITSQSSKPEDTIIEGSGFAVWASNITIKGFTLKGDNSDTGISLLNREGKCRIENNQILNYVSGIDTPVGSTFNFIGSNTISNCQDGITISEGFENTVDFNEVSNCQNGITFREGSENAIRNNKISGCQSGITYMEGFENTISNNEISNCRDGINLGNGDAAPTEIGTHIENNIITSNDVGISVGGIEGSYVISGNTISSNKNGYEDYTTGGNLIYNNYFNNSVNVNLQGNLKAQNTWNTSRITGKNIIGGSSIAGNYWAAPGGNGFSQTHFDTDGDSVSQGPYSLNGVNIDYLPLAFPAQKSAPMLPEVNFTANTTQGYAPLQVQFTDVSRYTTGRKWDFENDGIPDSTEVNPFHAYAAPGNYTVNLTAVNENGTGSKLLKITVLENPLLPSAKFSANSTQGPAPLSVQFTDLSENAVSWSWDFDNNGQPDSSDKNPICIYTISGNYTVNLTVKNGNGTASNTAVIVVTAGDNNSGENKSIDNYNGSIDNIDLGGGSSEGHSHKNGSSTLTVSRLPESAKGDGIKEVPENAPIKAANETEMKTGTDSRTTNESDTLNKGLETKQKHNTGIPGFEIGYAALSLLCAFLYRRK